jgi:hypothetical protein
MMPNARARRQGRSAIASMWPAHSGIGAVARAAAPRYAGAMGLGKAGAQRRDWVMISLPKELGPA